MQDVIQVCKTSFRVRARPLLLCLSCTQLLDRMHQDAEGHHPWSGTSQSIPMHPVLAGAIDRCVNAFHHTLSETM